MVKGMVNGHSEGMERVGNNGMFGLELGVLGKMEGGLLMVQNLMVTNEAVNKCIHNLFSRKQVSSALNKNLCWIIIFELSV